MFYHILKYIVKFYGRLLTSTNKTSRTHLSIGLKAEPTKCLRITKK